MNKFLKPGNYVRYTIYTQRFLNRYVLDRIEIMLSSDPQLQLRHSPIFFLELLDPEKVWRFRKSVAALNDAFDRSILSKNFYASLRITCQKVCSSSLIEKKSIIIRSWKLVIWCARTISDSGLWSRLRSNVYVVFRHIRRDKIRFSIPIINSWLVGNLEESELDHLTSQQARIRGCLDIKYIEKQISESGTFSSNLWDTLSLEMLFRKFID